MPAYYNEIDPYAAQWLRNLIAAGHIAPGDVDERSIVDVQPDDLRRYTQCHFFAGIGVWSYALRRAGWDDGRPVWTGSCPCQPFSAAGKRGGTADERHLWPHFFRLIEAVRPVAVFGEQVASKDGLAWLDAVYADLEGADYTCGAVDLCAAGVGAPHIRQRLFFVGHAADEGLSIRASKTVLGWKARRQRERPGNACELAHAKRGPAERHGLELAGAESSDQGRAEERQRLRNDAGDGVVSCELANSERERGCSGESWRGDAGDAGLAGETGPVNGFWRAADWLPCIDGKARPVESGTFPLAHGVAGRVGRLRAYGNAINAETAAAFIGAAREVIECAP